MKRIFTAFAAVALLAGASAAQQKPAATTPASNAQTKIAAQTETDLVAQLPASDFAATMNLKRIYNEVLPQFLAGNPAQLAKINRQVEEIRTKTGVDVRQFEQAAMSVAYKTGANGTPAIEALMLARGTFNPTALIGLTKVAVDGKYRQETVGGKTIVIVTIPQDKKPAQPSAAEKPDLIGQMIDSLFAGEYAVVALDSRTIAVGRPTQVRTMLGANTATARLDKDFASHLNGKSAAVMSFASKVPTNLLEAFGIGDLGDNQISKVVNSLRQLYGTVDANNTDASVSLAARTAAEAQAVELEELLQFGKNIGGSFLGGKSDAKNQAFARLIQNTVIARTANEVRIDTIVPGDIIRLLTADSKPPISAEAK